MNKSISEQLAAINGIMKKDPVLMDSNLSHYNAAEKCAAIIRWSKVQDFDFDISFTESVYDYYEEHGDISDKQMSVLDKIFSRYQIDIDRWL